LIFTMTLPRLLLHRLLLSATLFAAGLLPQSWAAPQQGSLVFSKTEISETAQPSQTEMVARFPFQNRGAKTVRILEIKTDCGCCTTGAPGKDAYGPGEQGEIAVTFKFGVFTGVQRKGVVVKTDDPAQPQVPLAVIATLPEVLSLRTNVLLWEENERAEPKALIVNTHRVTPVKELLATTDSRFLSVAVERVAPNEFHVRVTPATNRRNISATLHLEAVLEDAQRKRLNAFVRVR
jgi:hypothetical protein